MLTSLLDRRLFAERIGAPPGHVLALHGWARNRHDLVAVMGNTTGLSIDLPGFGASPPPPKPWRTADYAQFLAPLLDGLRHPRVVVGHSFGGRIAVHLAAAKPDAVDYLVLTGVPLLRGPIQSPPLHYRIVRSATRRGLLSPRFLESLRQKRGSADYRAATGVLRDILVAAVNEDYRELIGHVSCPVTLIYGEHDTAAPVAQAGEAASLFADAKLTIVADSGHLLDDHIVAAVRNVVTMAVGAERSST
ncbi:MAG: alpha/beta fold hydrolase [Pseudonocardiaceae bacterium]